MFDKFGISRAIACAAVANDQILLQQFNATTHSTPIHPPPPSHPPLTARSSRNVFARHHERRRDLEIIVIMHTKQEKYAQLKHGTGAKTRSSVRACVYHRHIPRRIHWYSPQTLCVMNIICLTVIHTYTAAVVVKRSSTSAAPHNGNRILCTNTIAAARRQENAPAAMTNSRTGIKHAQRVTSRVPRRLAAPNTRTRTQ